MAAAAKSLFRATRRRPPATALPLDLPLQHHPERDEVRRADDAYLTGEPEAIRGLLAVEMPRLRQFAAIWEPAAGEGHMCREIEAAGFRCPASDLRDRGWPGAQVRSFYDFAEPLAPAIISNPPYDQINARDGHGRWLRHSLALPGVRYVAYLLSWDWPAAHTNGHAELLAEFPFSYAYLCRWKIDFTGGGSPPQRNAWFVWDRDSDERLQLRFLDRHLDARQPAMSLPVEQPVFRSGRVG